MTNHKYLILLFLLMATVASAKNRKYPAKGEPFEGYGRRAAYDDVLDHCDLVLAGKVVGQREYVAELSTSQPEILGHVELEVQKVLRGQYTNKTASITHGSGYIGKLNNTNRVYVFMCLLSPNGKLRLAGEPPLGGGHVSEGLPLMEKLLEATRDPAKGYESSDFTLRVSSACRLAQAWRNMPEKDRQPPPPQLIETLIAGLRGYQHKLTENVEAACWNAIDDLFDCDIKSIWNYPPEMKKGRRTKLANDVGDAWKRTVESVRQRRAERTNQPHPDGEKFQLKVATLIEQLGGDDYPTRQAAQDELVKIGRPALKLVQAGTKDPDEDVARGCRLLVMLISQLHDFRPTDQSYRFNLDLAEPFVTEHKPQSATRGE